MQPTRDRTQSPDKRSRWAVCAFLLFVVAAIYGQTLWHPFLKYDESLYITDNPHVNHGLTADGLKWALTSGPVGEWYPLAMISHMLDCQLFGLRPWGHHLTNLVLHAATAIALFLVWRQMTGELWASAFVAAAFAVHPQRVESVAWLAERRDVLSGLLFMLCLGAYLGYVRHGRTLPRYALVALLFALALMTKPSVITLPALLLLLDFWPLGRIGSAGGVATAAPAVERPGLARLVLEKIPLFLLSAIAALVTLRTHAGAEASPAPMKVRLANAAVACVDYIVQLFYPVDLAVYYPLPRSGPPAWQVMGAVAILIAVSTAAVGWRRRCPYLFVGWFWYLGMLVPVLGLARIAHHARADRYTYLPSIGLAIVLAWSFEQLAATGIRRRTIVAAVAALAIAAWTACSIRQTTFWRGDEALWTHALASTTASGKAELGLAQALQLRGASEQAMHHYRRAIELGTDFNSFNGLGMLLMQQGKTSEAIDHFRKALRLQPDLAVVRANLGWALVAANQPEEADSEFRQALQLDPRSVNAHCGLAAVLRRQGNISQSRAQFEEALRIDPRKALAHVDLASLLLEQGETGLAIEHLETALAIEPRLATGHLNLARAGRPRATRAGRRALSPGHPAEPERPRPPPGARQARALIRRHVAKPAPGPWAPERGIMEPRGVARFRGNAVTTSSNRTSVGAISR